MNKKILTLLFLILNLNSTPSDIQKAVEQRCGSSFATLQESVETLVALSNQFNIYIEGLKVFRGEVDSSNPFNTTVSTKQQYFPCEGKNCPSFKYDHSFISQISTLKPLSSSDPNPNNCPSNAKLNNFFSSNYKFSPLIKASSNASCPKKTGDNSNCCCEIRCGSSACSDTNNLSYQVASPCMFNNTCGQNTNPITPPPTPYIMYKGVKYNIIGCNCSSTLTSLKNFNNVTRALSKSNSFSDNDSSSSSKSNSQVTWIGSGPPITNSNNEQISTVFMQCPICDVLYEYKNNIAVLKYQVLDFIYKQLNGSSDFSKKINQEVTTMLKNGDLCKSVTGEKSNNPFCKSICNIENGNCNTIKTPKKPLKPKRIVLTIPKYYIYDSQNKCTSENQDNCGYASNDKSYCLVEDMNIHVKFEKIQAYFSLLNQVYQSLATKLQKQYKTCAESYSKMLKNQLEAQVDSEQAYLAQLQIQSVKLQKINSKLSSANTAINMAMMPLMIIGPKIWGVLKQQMGADVKNNFNLFVKKPLRIVFKRVSNFIKKNFVGPKAANTEKAIQDVVDENASRETRQSNLQAVQRQVEEEFPKNSEPLIKSGAGENISNASEEISARTANLGSDLLNDETVDSEETMDEVFDALGSMVEDLLEITEEGAA